MTGPKGKLGTGVLPFKTVTWTCPYLRDRFLGQETRLILPMDLLTVGTMRPHRATSFLLLTSLAGAAIKSRGRPFSCLARIYD
jgi:hypothetical protein